jgi:hypothetical protein
MKNRFAGTEGLTVIAARYVRGLTSPSDRVTDNQITY